MCFFLLYKGVYILQGVRLFLLKNPWSHLRWKGNFSENDIQHWTPKMKKALKYDPKIAQTFDNGIMNYSSWDEIAVSNNINWCYYISEMTF